MAFNYNHIALVGRVDRVIAYTDSEPVQFSFGLKVDRPYRRDDGGCDTDIVPICTWGHLAKISKKIIRNDMPILVEGRLEITHDGTPRVIAENYQVLEGK